MLKGCVGLAAAVSASCAFGDLPAGYVETGRYAHPFDVFDVLPDGRLIGLSGDRVLVESEIHADTFMSLGATEPSFLRGSGASFVSVSPDGSMLAVGDNGFGNPDDAFVGVFELTGGVAITLTAAPNFDGVWADNSTLFVSGGSFADSNVITRIDVSTGVSTTVVDDTAGFSGAVAVHGGVLHAGNGFATGGPGDSQTGEVRAFDIAALTGEPVLSFERNGAVFGRALSAGSLDFDGDGNLIVGGGDLFGGSGDFGSVAVLDGMGGRIDIASPFGTGTNLAKFNPVTGEILVYSNTGEIVRFAAVPAPAGLGVLGLGLLCGRRRRA